MDEAVTQALHKFGRELARLARREAH
jgi:hypothetical protein